MFNPRHLSALALVGLLVAAGGADAAERHVNKRWTGPAGRSASYHRDRVQSPGAMSASAGWTGRAGRTGGYDRARMVDPEAGLASASFDRSYRDGSSRSVDRQATRQAPGEWAYSADRTQRDGDVISRSGVVTFPAPNP